MLRAWGLRWDSFFSQALVAWDQHDWWVKHQYERAASSLEVWRTTLSTFVPGTVPDSTGVAAGEYTVDDLTEL